MSESLLNRATQRRVNKLLGIDLSQVLRSMILAVGGIKGGVGKSTTAIFLAAVWSAMGLKVLIIDADPKSGTARKWKARAKQRGITLPFTVMSHPSEDLAERIEEEGWHLQYDLIIIDTGGDNDRILQAAYAIADYMLFTASPSPVDIDSLADSARTAIGQASGDPNAPVGIRDIPVRVVITSSRSDKMALRAKNDLRAAGVPVLTTVVKHRVPYQLAYGLVPTDLHDYPSVQHELDNP